MAEEKCGCDCNAAPTLIFACSGAADVGALADQAARRLTRMGVGGMYCLAGVGGRVRPIMETTVQAGRILAIDGCPLDCVRHTLEQAGFRATAHLRVTDLGLKKGSSPVTEENIAKVVMQGQALLT
jgi:uncharacterized metal-binding protein